MKKKNGIHYKNIFLAVFSLTMAITGFAGYYYELKKDADEFLVTYIRNHFTGSIALLICMTFGIYAIIRYLYQKIDELRFDEKPINRKKLIIIYSVAVFASWLPYLIISYPCSSMGWDYNWQLLQGMGVYPLSDHHPILGSLIYGFLYKIGFLFGGAEGGLFFSALFQVSLMSFAMGFAFSTLRLLKCPRVICMILLVFSGLNPVFATYASWLIKDSIYSSLIVLLYALAIELSCNNKKGEQVEKNTLVLFIVTAFFATQFRQEGILIVGFLLFTLLFQTIIRKNKKNIIRMVSAVAIIFLLFLSVKLGIIVFRICPTAAFSEAFTMFSMQAISYTLKYPEEISEDDYRVLYQSYSDFDEAKEHYNLVYRDPVKLKQMDIHGVSAFLKVWLKMGLHHPESHIKSFLLGSNGYWWLFKDPKTIIFPTALFAPENDFANEERRNTTILPDASMTARMFEYYGLDTGKTIGEYVAENNPKLEGIFNIRSAFPKQRDSINKFFDILKEVPIVQLLFVPGFYTTIVLFSLGYLISRRKNLFAVSLPIFGIIISCCNAPVNGYMRYFLPVALSSVVLFGLCFTPKDNENRDQTFNTNN